MTRILLKGLACGSAAVIILTIMLAMPGIGRVAEVLLQPGYVLPRAYWGAAHDIAQLLLVVMLAVCFYTLVFSLGFKLRRCAAKPTRDQSQR
jgi:hypothetical protein